MTTNGKYKLDIEKRLTTLEVSFGSLRDEMRAEFKELKENHIAHLDSKMWWGVALAISVLTGLVIDLGLRLF